MPEHEAGEAGVVFAGADEKVRVGEVMSIEVVGDILRRDGLAFFDEFIDGSSDFITTAVVKGNGSS